MANPKVSKKDADVAKEAAAALRNIASRTDSWRDQNWAGAFPGKTGLEMNMAFLTTVASGLKALDSILSAQRTLELVNRSSGAVDQPVGFDDFTLEGLYDAQSALATAFDSKMCSLMEKYGAASSAEVSA